MKKSFTFVLVLSLFSVSLFSQKKEIIDLWPGKVPGESGDKQKPAVDTTKKDGVLRYSKITDPAIEVFLPESHASNGSGVIICPGGAYRILAYDKEGTEIAQWLNGLGYAAFVLSYRVPDKRDGALQDAQRAIRIVRSRAAGWNINPDRIGIMGFSAGGSLSARAATGFKRGTYHPADKTDSLSCRPSFAMLIYPAYLDQGPDRSLTPELTLSKETPPVFIFQTADDPYGNSSLVMAGALRDSKLPVEMHLMPKGGHGYGLRPGNPAGEAWPLFAERWLSKTLNPTK